MSETRDFFLGVLSAAAVTFLLIVLLFCSAGCASTGVYQMSDEWCAARPEAPASMCHGHPAQSWDQENLKRNDVADCLHGNPVFIAPGGNLEQCEPVVFGIAGTTSFVPIEKPHGFPTIEAAAIAGLTSIAAKPTAIYYEWGGNLALDTQSGEFYYSAPTTSMHGDHVHLDDDDDLPPAFKDVGSFHTHPCLPQHQPDFFSSADLAEALFGHGTVFMGNFCTGEVHEFVPGDKPDTEIIPHNNSWSTRGRIIGSFTKPRDLLVVE